MKNDPDMIRLARELRRNQTPAESILWSMLRDRRFADFKFRRQVPIGRYIADFCSRPLQLIVELDGESHIGKEVQDGKREEWLTTNGWRVLRIWNTSIYEQCDAVLEGIWQECSRPANAKVRHDGW